MQHNNAHVLGVRRENGDNCIWTSILKKEHSRYPGAPGETDTLQAFIPSFAGIGESQNPLCSWQTSLPPLHSSHQASPPLSA